MINLIDLKISNNGIILIDGKILIYRVLIIQVIMIHLSIILSRRSNLGMIPFPSLLYLYGFEEYTGKINHHLKC